MSVSSDINTLSHALLLLLSAIWWWKSQVQKLARKDCVTVEGSLLQEKARRVCPKKYISQITMPRAQKEHQGRATSSHANQRNRASPARLIKLYGVLFEGQHKMIRDIKFDRLLKIACSTIPADFANWLMVECFNAET
jgi:hypothetical protein